MTLQQKLDDFKSEFESSSPPYKAPKAIIENLSLGYGRATPVRIGRTRPEDRDRAPAFTLNNHDGNSLSSAELLAKGPLVITSFRGHW
jgi:hypothetical protein